MSPKPTAMNFDFSSVFSRFLCSEWTKYFWDFRLWQNLESDQMEVYKPGFETTNIVSAQTLTDDNFKESTKGNWCFREKRLCFED